MHIHILGICGTFMGGLALLAQQLGYKVSGCDQQVFPPMSTQLAAAGIPLIEGYCHDPQKIAADLYIVGNVISRANPLMETILNQGLAYTSGAQWLAETVLRCQPRPPWVLAVAGTHGKTTTSAMLAWILEVAGYQPGFLIGGIPKNFACSARLMQASMQQTSYFVIEADEYDTAFFDKHPKFIHYRPRTLILNNLEYDHADIFADLAAIEKQFAYLLRTVPAQGQIIAHGAQASIARVLAQGCWTPVEYFAHPQGWSLGQQSHDSFEVCYQQRPQGIVQWELIGEYNRYNALAAIAAAAHVGVPPALAVQALASFRSVKRRMELRGVCQHIHVYEDFAHHPSAIASALAGLRAMVGDARILAVFEPRSNSMKMGALQAQLASSLKQADLSFCYAGGIHWDIHAALAPLAPHFYCYEQIDDLLAALSTHARAGDHILVMSNGSFDNMLERLLQGLNARLPVEH